MFNTFMDQLEQSLHIKDIESKDSLEKQNKEYLIKKILYLQEQVKNNKELGKAIKEAVTESIYALTGNENTVSIQANGKLSFATTESMNKGFYTINESIDSIRNNFSEFKEKIKKIDDYNKKVDDFKKWNIIYDINRDIPKYNIYDEVEDSTLQKHIDEMNEIYNNQYYYDKGYNDCVRQCKRLAQRKLKSVSFRSIRNRDED